MRKSVFYLLVFLCVTRYSFFKPKNWENINNQWT